MKRRKEKAFVKKVLLLLAAALIVSLPLNGCNGITNKKVKLDPENPVTISIWHYYNGAIMNAFESMVKEFNETVGAKEGIIVEDYGMGNVSELEKAVLASANKESGSIEMPDIFASYADTVYAAEKMNLLANLDDYFTKEEQKEYLDSYIEEGRIGLNGELRIFPIAKSTEIFIINETDWTPFAQANGLTYDNLATMEDIAQVAEMYYKWTDSKTHDTPNDGKSFFGRDSMANLFIVASKQFGTELFRVKNGVATVEIKADVMRKIWDNYYLPYVRGHFYSYGRYRSDDAKVGDILAYVGATSSAAYFPSEVTANGTVYPIKAKVLPVPGFKGAAKTIVQQGAGMSVVKSTPQSEYASVVFLKWFTETQNNTEFSALSGYMPVKKEAVDYDALVSRLTAAGQTIDEITSETLRIAFEEIKTSELHTNKAFDGGANARAVLEHHLQDKAIADREAFLKAIEGGSSHEQAVAMFNTEDNFNNWLEDITKELNV